MSTLMTVLLYMHSNEAQLWTHSTSVIRISISEQNETLDHLIQPTHFRQESWSPEETKLLGGRSEIRIPPTALSTTQQLPTSSKYLFDISHHVCCPLIRIAILLAIKNLHPLEELCLSGTLELNNYTLVFSRVLISKWGLQASGLLKMQNLGTHPRSTDPESKLMYSSWWYASLDIPFLYFLLDCRNFTCFSKSLNIQKVRGVFVADEDWEVKMQSVSPLKGQT